jgi:hypothetical protein
MILKNKHELKLFYLKIKWATSINVDFLSLTLLLLFSLICFSYFKKSDRSKIFTDVHSKQNFDTHDSIVFNSIRCCSFLHIY